MANMKIVARFTDGRVVKGRTQDFSPLKDTFHIHQDMEEGGGAVLVERAALKALFFVKTFEGDSEHIEKLGFEGARGQGRKMLVTFTDGESLTGFTMGYSKDRPGFFLFPTDPESNNERIFVILKSVAAIEPVT